jgi:raffinose/stachyose/melibiose transport system permease protein
MKTNYRAKQAVFLDILKHFVLILWALTTIIPLLWVLLNSFKTSGEILRSSFALPGSFNLRNFTTVLNYPDVNMLRSFRNSFIISGSVVVLVVFIAGLASFALGRFDVKTRRPILALLTGCLLVPTFATVIPNFVTISYLPFIRGKYLAAIIPQTAGNLCFSTILLTGFMRALPRELDEAALMDGVSIPWIFFRIAMPLCKSMFATISIMVFIWSYNDLFTSLVYIADQRLKPICVILSMVSNMYGTDYGAMMAAIIITIMPLFLLYMFSQEQVVKGLTTGAVKE